MRAKGYRLLVSVAAAVAAVSAGISFSLLCSNLLVFVREPVPSLRLHEELILLSYQSNGRQSCSLRLLVVQDRQSIARANAETAGRRGRRRLTDWQRRSEEEGGRKILTTMKDEMTRTSRSTDNFFLPA